jgi:hypothetical protein
VCYRDGLDVVKKTSRCLSRVEPQSFGSPTSNPIKTLGSSGPYTESSGSLPCSQEQSESSVKSCCNLNVTYRLRLDLPSDSSLQAAMQNKYRQNRSSCGYTERLSSLFWCNKTNPSVRGGGVHVSERGIIAQFRH